MSGYETDDCEWDGFVSPLQVELDENQQKLSLIEKDGNNSSISRIEILKSAMTFQKENDVEMIKFQQEQISLLWSELAKNHKVIDQLLEQNTMFYRLLQQNNNSAHVPHENNSSPFLRSQEMAEGYFDNAPISKKFGDQEKNRLVEVTIFPVGRF